MRIVIPLHLDELPVADWLNTRANEPPPGASWGPGGTRLSQTNEFSFDDGLESVLLDLLDLYVVTVENDPDLNPESANAALRLREKIVEAVEGHA
jgi:hypothetical protein